MISLPDKFVLGSHILISDNTPINRSFCLPAACSYLYRHDERAAAALYAC